MTARSGPICRRRGGSGEEIERPRLMGDADDGRTLDAGEEEVNYVVDDEGNTQAELTITDADVVAAGGEFVDGAVIKCLDLHSTDAEVIDLDGEDPDRYIEVTVEDAGETFVYLCTKA